MASACSIVLARDPTSMMGGMYPSTDGRLGSRASSCVLMSVAVICVCVMVVCGVFVLREYTLAKNYEETSCRLTNITYSGDIGCMHCSGVKETNKGAEGGSGGSCAHTHFPCLHVLVSYTYNRTANRAAMLYENSVQAVGAYSQCSYSVCLKTREENQRVVDEFAGLWRSKSLRGDFRCYYDSDDQDKVIAHKTYSRWDVIHSMLWPSLVLLLCGCLFLHLETRRRGLTFCGTKDEKAAKNQPDLALRDGTNAVSGGGGQEKWSTSPSRDRLLQGSQVGETAGLDRRSKHPGKERPSKLSASMSSLEKVSTRTTKPSSHLNWGAGGEGGGGGGGIGGGCNERLLKRKTASVDRLADVRVKPDNGKRYPV